MLDSVRQCFMLDRALYTKHARQEMLGEEHGTITEGEVFEAIQEGEVIESYPDDEPYPSILVLGKTRHGRTIHIVCAYSEQDELAIVITAYEPDPSRWIDGRRRR
ncbi:DUF4258 domain-containing protein [Dehalococcoidales bacterium]|nr:DUF4258 domain-containing protein [Dehalococcoidales bacterium]MCL0052985.1 DUF4258 domain-containing protein [Dehalococcoidales bacterium]MCL0091831.1 DUF4258 domain-containing protein [Dehalococcoidales bacterium]